MENLKGKNALITGSTSGIGLAIAKELAKRGVNIFLNGIESIDEVNQIKREMSTSNPGLIDYFQADLSKVNEIEKMCAVLLSKGQGIDILINNAGIQHVDWIEDFPPSKWDHILALNLSAAFHTIRLLMPSMKKKNWGRILNIASVHGLVASAQKTAYVAAKHGLIGLTKAVALETATTGITCNAICPGWVLTPLVEKQIRERARLQNKEYETAKADLLKEKQPTQQFINPESIGEYVAFLCSEAANQITGAALTMDGGWTAQ